MTDVRLFIGSQPLNTATAIPTKLQAVTNVSLTFTTQKNGIKGEVISHGLSGHGMTCPVKALIWRISYLRQHGASPNTALCAYYDGTRFGTSTHAV